MPSRVSNSISDIERISRNGIGKTNPVLLSFGGNSGSTAQHFENALHCLSSSGFRILAVSSPIVTKPVGCEPGAPDFLNMAAAGEWHGTPLELLDLIHSIEIAEGRPADHPHWHSRTLDIDIILMGTMRIRSERLTVPHPLAHTRDFVLIPSRQIVPADWLEQMGLC